MRTTHISAFDLDGTLLVGSSSYQFCKYLSNLKVLPFYSTSLSALYYLQHHYFSLPLKDLHNKVFQRLLIGLPLNDLEKHVQGFLDQFLPGALFFPLVNALRLAQHLGHYTLILSNSPSFLVEPIAKYFGVDEWKATVYGVDKDQKLCNIRSILEGEDKALFLQHLAEKLGVGLNEVTAYSDSSLDLPFLRSAGQAVAVRPDKKLRRYSLKQHWKIIE